jgi:hypothetical protein
MRPYTLGRWLLAGLLGASCVPGCTEVGPRRVVVVRRYYASASPNEQAVPAAQFAATPYNPSGRPVQSTAQVAQKNAPAPVESVSVDTTPPLTPEVPAETAPLQVAEQANPTLAAPQPVDELSPAETQECGTVAAAAPPPSESACSAVQESLAPVTVLSEIPSSPPPPAIDPDAKPLFPRGEPAPARRSFVDLSAAPCFAHASDYSWITGQVEQSRAAKEWRLRYASVDEEDRYGGRVVLIEDQHLAYLKDGDYVRVRGHMTSTDEATGRATYRIESFEVLHDPNGGASK